MSRKHIPFFHSRSVSLGARITRQKADEECDVMVDNAILDCTEKIQKQVAGYVASSGMNIAEAKFDVQKTPISVQNGVAEVMQITVIMTVTFESAS
jgi:hypothetical protein